jgi:SAM-dependent methyltransferase
MTTMDFYSGDLNVSTYDLGVGILGGGASDDVAFYVDLAAGAGPDVLELGCGTRRLMVRLAEAGFRVTGLDRSPGMLAQAAAKLSRLDPAVKTATRLVQGDISTFALGMTFDTILLPARVFGFLLTIDDQRACLARVLDHLRPGGLIAIDMFDPRLDLCLPGGTPGRTDTKIDPGTGDTIRVDVVYRENDALRQIGREVWRFSRLDSSGRVVDSEELQLELRWTYRYEMRHLLELSGFRDAVEYSDFDRSPPAYGVEQVWVAQRPG